MQQQQAAQQPPAQSAPAAQQQQQHQMQPSPDFTAQYQLQKPQLPQFNTIQAPSNQEKEKDRYLIRILFGYIRFRLQ